MKIKAWITHNWTTLLGFAFLAIIGSVLWDRLSNMDWQKTFEKFAETPWIVTTGALALSFISYSLYSSLDWIGLRRAKSKPSVLPSLLSAFICYAANFNFGSLLGGIGMRFKLYSDLDISKSQIARIAALSTLSTWTGYALFAGLFFAFAPMHLFKTDWLADFPWRPIGYAGVGTVALLFLLISKKRSLKFFKHKIELVSLKEGMLRVGIGVSNWMVVSSILALIFAWHYSAPLSLVVLTYLAAAIAGVIVHVPGGIGVIEATFLATVGRVIGDSEVMAGMLYFRLIYYLVPLALALFTGVILKTKLNRNSGI